MSISPTFYAQLFHTKVLRKAFLYLHFRFELFFDCNIGCENVVCVECFKNNNNFNNFYRAHSIQLKIESRRFVACKRAADLESISIIKFYDK